MAVYTKVSNDNLSQLLEKYDIGKSIELTPIEQGIENSNYFLTTDKNKYVLTIYEKRINQDDLPFYLNLMDHLAEANIPCPVPIKNNSKDKLSEVCEKPCAIISFLHGKNAISLNNQHLKELGKNMAMMHKASENFKMTKHNDFSLASWQELFDSVKPKLDEIGFNISKEIEETLTFLEENWPSDLPKGVIHADLFPDNVFFSDEKLVGIIDFYFACNDFLIYDLAVCLNSWCFENGNEFNITKAKLLFESYSKVRKISQAELDALPILAKGAAMRFLLTRLYDRFNQVEGALVKPKNPLEYLQRLRFHNRIKSYTEYGI